MNVTETNLQTAVGANPLIEQLQEQHVKDPDAKTVAETALKLYDTAGTLEFYIAGYYASFDVSGCLHLFKRVASLKLREPKQRKRMPLRVAAKAIMQNNHKARAAKEKAKKSK